MMYRKITKCGNSIGITLDKTALEKIGLKRGDWVKIEVVDHKIIITPAK